MDVEEPNNRARDALDAAMDTELQQARDRAASLDQRAMAIITTSGVLVSLAFGFGTLIKGKQITSLPAAPKTLLALALLSFVAAAIAALLTVMPRSYPAESEWKKLLGTWIVSPDQTWASMTTLHLTEISHWLGTNDLKTKILLMAISAECLGILLLTISLLTVVL
jgi:hypothetical protein